MKACDCFCYLHYKLNLILDVAHAGPFSPKSGPKRASFTNFIFQSYSIAVLEITIG